MKTELLPFRGEMIPDAGKLLAKRHTCNRRNLPLLPTRFEDPQISAKAVETLWQEKFSSGYAAFRNGKMTAYLIGSFADQPWARSGYVHLHGYALDDGESIATLQDLYALVGDDWVRKGIFSHNLYISAADTKIIDGLFAIGFGQERVDALLDLRTLEIPKVDEPEGMTIRRARKGDEEHLGSVAYAMIDALSSAPYWLPITPEDRLGWKERWAKRADAEEWMVWMALENDQTAGTVAFILDVEQEEEDQMLISKRTLHLGTAATRPEMRGRGIANILTWRGLEDAQRLGFENCLVNWVSPNLLAARYWPRFGFKDAAYRLSKQVNPMIAWANGE